MKNSIFIFIGIIFLNFYKSADIKDVFNYFGFMLDCNAHLESKLIMMNKEFYKKFGRFDLNFYSCSHEEGCYCTGSVNQKSEWLCCKKNYYCVDVRFQKGGKELRGKCISKSKEIKFTNDDKNNRMLRNILR